MRDELAPLNALLDQGDLWVFGYGSLIWNPEFPVAERRLARLEGWSRSFCMWSYHYRGTIDQPGLVLALDRDPEGACEGVAFRVEKGAEAATLEALRARELISSAYLEASAEVATASGPKRALLYVVDPNHAQYCGGLTLAEQARIIRTAHGERGSNTDYLWSTDQHLQDLGISDPDLRWLAAEVRKPEPR